jgi:hypothetical protein
LAIFVLSLSPLDSFPVFFFFFRFFGGYSEGETPVPIPNTEVKPFSADGTAWEAARESRTLPKFIQSKAPWFSKGLFVSVFLNSCNRPPAAGQISGVEATLRINPRISPWGLHELL